MIHEEYKKKLKAFNSTRNYLNELGVLHGLLDPQDNDLIIDYGAGIGTAIEYLQQRSLSNIYGYDIHRYSNDYRWISDFEYVDKVYFMHSFAHIPNIVDVMSDLSGKVQDRVVIITPNRNWLEIIKNENYVPDPTVHRHYNIDEMYIMLNDCGFYVDMIGGIGETLSGHHERCFIVAKPK